MIPTAAGSLPDSTALPVILLVEDHEDTRQMYVAFLSATFDVMSAADATEALNLINSRPPDLVITDVSLPGMDGLELIARLREDPRLQSVPTICLSGYGGEAHQERAREVGCARVVEKPCMPDVLAAIAADVLRVANGSVQS
ncbi:MAG: response regulator [Acidobacteriota bacterium]